MVSGFWASPSRFPWAERVELLNGAHLLKIEAAQNECPPCVRPQTLPQYDQSHCKIEHMVKNAIIAYD